MNRWLFVGLGTLALAVLAWGGMWYQRSLTDQRPGGEQVKLQFFSNPVAVQALTMKTLDGRVLSSADWRGKVTILNFWATWCAPCRAEIPDLVALQQKYGDKLQIIGISEDEEPPEVVKRFADQYHINYPVVMKTPEIGQAFPGIYALPTTVILDRELRVVQRHVGLLNREMTELETLALAGLLPNAAIEYVEYEDENKKLIKNAAQATSIPGIELDKLTPVAKAAVLQKLNAESCTCGCGLTLAACRINDPTCHISLPIAQKLVAEARAGPEARP